MFICNLTHSECRDFDNMCSTNKSGALQQYASDVYKILCDNDLQSWEVAVIPETATGVVNDIVYEMDKDSPFKVKSWEYKEYRIDLIFTDETEAIQFKLIYQEEE